MGAQELAWFEAERGDVKGNVFPITYLLLQDYKVVKGCPSVELGESGADRRKGKNR